MLSGRHWAIFVNNDSRKDWFLESLVQGRLPGFEILKGKKGAIFSRKVLEEFMEEEIRHDRKILTRDTAQNLQTMSSGERKKALLKYLLQSEPQYLILDSPFDNLDRRSQEALKATLDGVSDRIPLIQILSRSGDLLPFVNRYCRLKGRELQWYNSIQEFPKDLDLQPFKKSIPPPPEHVEYLKDYLVRFKKVSVSYGSKPVLKDIQWDIKPGDYWQLAGPNGSGKTTLLSMITGDNPKAYGQELYLFGRQKGTGESVWDIKKNLGYFTPAMVDRFRGYHTLEHMLISGLTDSIGLYQQPTEVQKRLAQQWLELLGMEEMAGRYFHELSQGQQRLLMCARAMVKHPLLLILDEPTAGLDEASAVLVIALVNKIAKESRAAVIFVSHRDEKGLQPSKVFELFQGDQGSKGKVKIVKR